MLFAMFLRPGRAVWMLTAHRSQLSRAFAYRPRVRNDVPPKTKISEEEVRKLVDPKGHLKKAVFVIFAGSFFYGWNFYFLPWWHKDDKRQTEKLDPHRKFTWKELQKYDGQDPTSPIYVAVCGIVYDVTESGAYEPSYGYSSMAGRDASWLLATMSLEPAHVYQVSGPDPRLASLSSSDLKTLNEWQDYFAKKYSVAGILI